MSIPTLDLSAPREEAAKVLVSALNDPGFLYVKNIRGYDPGTAASRTLSLTLHRGVRRGRNHVAIGQKV